MEEMITIGNKQEVIMENEVLIPKFLENSSDTIYDLASTTKIFTALSILKLYQNGLYLFWGNVMLFYIGYNFFFNFWDMF